MCILLICLFKIHHHTIFNLKNCPTYSLQAKLNKNNNFILVHKKAEIRLFVK